MIRGIGGIMILAGCLGLGLWYRQQFVERIKALRCLLKILEMMYSEVSYGRSTMPECCRLLGEQQEEPYGAFFRSIFRRMQENRGESFQTVFQEEMKALEGLALSGSDREAFAGIAAVAPSSDSRLQLQLIERAKEQLGHTMEELERENQTKCRLAVGLGAMSGFLLLLILL